MPGTFPGLNAVHFAVNAFGVGGLPSMRDVPILSAPDPVGAGRGQIVCAETWHLRMELEDLGAGELVGVGLLSMPPEAASPAEVLIGGTTEHDGTVRLRLLPTGAQHELPIRLRVRVVPHPDTNEPIVSEVLEAEGSPTVPAVLWPVDA